MSELEGKSLPHEVITIDESLCLRQLQPEEAHQIFALVDRNRDYLAKWLPWAEHTRSSADSEEFIHQMLSKRADGSEYGYGIVLNGKPVGHMSLMHLTDGGQPEIGYWVASEMAGQGIATKAAGALTAFGFEVLGLQRIIIKAQPDNLASNKVAQKLGYTLDETVFDEEANQTTNIWAKIK